LVGLSKGSRLPFFRKLGDKGTAESAMHRDPNLVYGRRRMSFHQKGPPWIFLRVSLRGRIGSAQKNGDDGRRNARVGGRTAHALPPKFGDDGPGGFGARTFVGHREGKTRRGRRAVKFRAMGGRAALQSMRTTSSGRPPGIGRFVYSFTIKGGTGWDGRPFGHNAIRPSAAEIVPTRQPAVEMPT